MQGRETRRTIDAEAWSQANLGAEFQAPTARRRCGE